MFRKAAVSIPRAGAVTTPYVNEAAANTKKTTSAMTTNRDLFGGDLVIKSSCLVFLTAWLESELGPEQIYSLLHLFGHPYFFGPRPIEALRLPLSGSVYAHLRTEVRQPR